MYCHELTQMFGGGTKSRQRTAPKKLRAARFCNILLLFCENHFIKFKLMSASLDSRSGNGVRVPGGCEARGPGGITGPGGATARGWGNIIMDIIIYSRVRIMADHCQLCSINIHLVLQQKLPGPISSPDYLNIHL